MTDNQTDSLRQAALTYHEYPKPGKLEIRATKPLANGRDLARAYSPGVAAALKSRTAPRMPAAILRAAIWWPLSPTDRPFWASGTSAHWPPNP